MLELPNRFSLAYFPVFFFFLKYPRVVEKIEFNSVIWLNQWVYVCGWKFDFFLFKNIGIPQRKKNTSLKAEGRKKGANWVEIRISCFIRLFFFCRIDNDNDVMFTYRIHKNHIKLILHNVHKCSNERLI